ncbi:MAG: GlcG/HbpS family heme-binding protein, partial [Burkholderiales bacterium]
AEVNGMAWHFFRSIRALCAVKRYFRVSCVLAMVCGLLISPVFADSPTLSAQAVQQLLDAALKKAAAINVPVAVTVVDTGGNMAGFIRMEGTRLHGIHTSYSKAYSAVSLGRPSHQSGIPSAIERQIQSATGGKFVSIPGGLPITVSGRVVGAIGVSGGNGDQDVAVAQAALDALARQR